MSAVKRFKDVKIGERFQFAFMPHWLDIARGPWIKTSPRKYRHVDLNTEHRVGTIHTEVQS